MTEHTPPTSPDDRPDENDRPVDTSQAREGAGDEETGPDLPDIMKQTTP